MSNCYNQQESTVATLVVTAGAAVVEMFVLVTEAVAAEVVAAEAVAAKAITTGVPTLVMEILVAEVIRLKAIAIVLKKPTCSVQNEPNGELVARQRCWRKQSIYPP